MKSIRQKNWGWCLAITIIIFPLIAILIIEPIWIARLIGLAPLFLLPTIICFWGATIHHSLLLKSNSSLYDKYDREKVDLISRMALILAGIIVCIFMFLPYIKDVVAVIRNKAPIEYTGTVVYTAGMGRGLITEKVVFNTYPPALRENSFTAWYFPPEYIVNGGYYRVFYIPNTRIILEAQKIVK